jgi:MFS family permease
METSMVQTVQIEPLILPSEAINPTVGQGKRGASVPDPRNLPLPRRLLAFAFVLLAEFFYGWAWNTVDVLRPFFRDSLGLTLTEAGSAYSAQGAGALAGAVIAGQMADRLGQRRMLVVIMAGYGVMLLGGVAVQSYFQLILQRFGLGLFLGGSFPVIVGIYVGLFAPEVRGRAASLVNAVFSLAIVTLGFAFGLVGSDDWRLLLWIGGIPPILLSLIGLVVIPDVAKLASPTKLPISELFVPAVRKRTLLLATVTGLNFFAYQAFSGWLTIYLKDVRALPPEVIGNLVAAQFAGNILGGFAWGWAGDRLGRRFSSLGFWIAAVAIVTYLTVPNSAPLLAVIGFVYGFSLSCSVVWGPWFAELYPPHLRSTAASIFNWGRLISFFSPLITGMLAEAFGLRGAMLAASVAFLVAALIWRCLPETLVRSPAA